MAYGTIYSDTVQGSTANTAPVFKDGNTVEIGQLCKSWINYNGTSGSVSTRASFNISSLTRSGTGTYYVITNIAFVDTSYCVTTTCDKAAGGDHYMGVTDIASSVPTTSKIYVEIIDPHTAFEDSTQCCINIIR